MKLMEAVDPVAFETWMSSHFMRGGALNSGGRSLALQSLMASAVMDPTVTILSRAVAETGVDETQARITIALIHGFLHTECKEKGTCYVERS